MDERIFLERVRAAVAAGHDESAGVAAREGESVAPGSSVPSAELVERFVREAREAGAVVERAATAGDAREAVVSILAGRGARRIVRTDEVLLARLGLDAALAARGIETLVAGGGVSAAELRERLFEADAGVTGAEAAVAETGTLVLVAGAGRPRAASLLPPLHVAVVRAASLVADLGAFFARPSEAPPSALVFVTGPSRTADIELVLTVGVHGPRELAVVFLED